MQAHDISKESVKGSLIASEISRYKRRFFYKKPKVLAVTATAYTSHVGQTDSTPNIAAWGDRLHPGMKVIAVSRDLLNKYGLKHNSKVKIRGLSGEYLVLDKMNRRWHKKIDIYMGKDRKKAFRWGHKKVVIEWIPD
ncbi:MAG: 3D domain-containing protein [Thiotrichaceae bacterium]|nr:3D domain-containing protein [Thiotrichaceae bacterium]